MYLLTLITDRAMKVVKILGTMITFKTTPGGGLSDSSLAIMSGFIAHCLIGICFAVCYLLLWRRGIGSPDFVYALLFGFVNGLAGLLLWRVLFAVHPDPPGIALKPYLISLLIAHIVFAIVVVYTFRLLH